MEDAYRHPESYFETSGGQDADILSEAAWGIKDLEHYLDIAAEADRLAALLGDNGTASDTES